MRRTGAKKKNNPPKTNDLFRTLVINYTFVPNFSPFSVAIANSYIQQPTTIRPFLSARFSGTRHDGGGDLFPITSSLIHVYTYMKDIVFIHTLIIHIHTYTCSLIHINTLILHTHTHQTNTILQGPPR